MLTARRMVRRQFGRDHHPVYRALAQVLVAIAWPPAVLILLWRIRYFRGSQAVPIKQVPGALWAALRHNIEPGEYYAYALWHPDRKLNIDNYLYSREGPRLFKLLNRPSHPNPIDDKLTFHELCRAHALPSPEVLAVFTPTGKLLEFASGRAPTCDLFVKPRFGVAGHGTEHLRWQGVAFESGRGCRLTPEELGGYLATRALTENRAFLVQPALANDPRLGIGVHTYLAPARLVTGLSSDGNVVPLFGSFIYFTRAGDQILSRRIALIDVSNGRLTWAPREIAGVKRWIPQVDSGLNDALLLPDWDIVLRHTKVAHQACTNFVFLGWDVGFTQHGPMLLEGNANWCADDYQRLRGEPLGCTKFADILASRLHELKDI
jgi:hypothetical protein